jgi:hypothetical protein
LTLFVRVAAGSGVKELCGTRTFVTSKILQELGPCAGAAHSWLKRRSPAEIFAIWRVDGLIWRFGGCPNETGMLPDVPHSQQNEINRKFLSSSLLICGWRLASTKLSPRMVFLKQNIICQYFHTYQSSTSFCAFFSPVNRTCFESLDLNSWLIKHSLFEDNYFYRRWGGQPKLMVMPTIRSVY